MPPFCPFWISPATTFALYSRPPDCGQIQGKSAPPPATGMDGEADLIRVLDLGNEPGPAAEQQHLPKPALALRINAILILWFSLRV